MIHNFLIKFDQFQHLLIFGIICEKYSFKKKWKENSSFICFKKRRRTKQKILYTPPNALLFEMILYVVFIIYICNFSLIKILFWTSSFKNLLPYYTYILFYIKNMKLGIYVLNYSAATTTTTIYTLTSTATGTIISNKKKWN
jgi:hypothetical protein